MPKFNLYSAWMDPVFYVWAAVFAAALVAMVYSIRKYIELKNASFEDEDRSEEAAADEAAPAEFLQPAQQEFPEVVSESPAEAPAEAAPEAAPDADLPCAAPAEESQAAGSPAENFVRGIYEGISGLDSRLKGIESALSKSRVNNDFTVNFLEDILQDIDNLDKAKLKARIEYLLSDLKK